MAVRIVDNGKTSRPSVCNALETVLVHKSVAEAFLPAMRAALDAHHVELRGCEITQKILPGVLAATEEDYYTEFDDYILAVRVVDSLDDAIAHIGKYSSRHSDGIVTNDLAASRRFVAEVDAAAVYVNASTRFTDGGEFGLGAEIGISTQKLHTRGPMGLCDLHRKYVVTAAQIRFMPRRGRRRGTMSTENASERPATKEIFLSVGAVIFAFAVVARFRAVLGDGACARLGRRFRRAGQI
jgi:glutamate-5-semialdehyde dehydrogenase